MSKAEALAEKHFDDLYRDGLANQRARCVAAINEALEWAAQVCESDSREWVREAPSPQYLAAERIRAGKS